MFISYFAQKYIFLSYNINVKAENNTTDINSFNSLIQVINYLMILLYLPHLMIINIVGFLYYLS